MSEFIFTNKDRFLNEIGLKIAIDMYKKDVDFFHKNNLNKMYSLSKLIMFLEYSIINKHCI